MPLTQNCLFIAISFYRNVTILCAKMSSVMRALKRPYKPTNIVIVEHCLKINNAIEPIQEFKKVFINCYRNLNKQL